jgi:hypothetical protein
VFKADIRKSRDHILASCACFHSQRNRIKGDRRWRPSVARRLGLRVFQLEMMGMSSRALSLATVLVLTALDADTAWAQAQNLEAGKSPSQIFAQTCNACHRSPRGLLKSVAPGSLPGFLRQHYTTSSDMAGVLASYLVSNGATDSRYQAKDGKGGAKDKEKEASSNATQQQQAPEHQGRRHRQDAAKPEGEDAAVPASETGRAGQKRMARPAEEGAKENTKPEAQATNERSPEGRKSKQRLSKRGKPETEETPKDTGKDVPKADTPKDMPAAAPPADEKEAEPKSDTAKVDAGRDEAKSESKSESKPDGAKSADGPGEAKPETAKIEPGSSETPALRPDPVPQVTPAPPAAAKPAETTTTKPAEAKPAEATTNGNSEPPAAKSQEAPSSATAASPPPAPADQSGSPTPPISR